MNDALKEFTVARLMIDVEGHATEPTTRGGGAHRSQRHAPMVKST